MLQQYGMLQDLDAVDYNRHMDQMALVQPQVLEMLQNGARPSQEMLAASGLSQEYVDALYPENTGGTGWGPGMVNPPPSGGEAMSYVDTFHAIEDQWNKGYMTLEDVATAAPQPNVWKDTSVMMSFSIFI